MILADLPYGTLNSSQAWDVPIPFDVMWREFSRVIKPSHAIVLTASQPFTSALLMSKPKWFRHHWVWDKKLGGNSHQVKKAPLKIHEDVLVFADRGVRYFPQMKKGLMTYKGFRCAKNHVLNSEANTLSKNDEYYPKSIVPFQRPIRDRLHPTQKPVELFEYLMKTYSLEGEMVLDICAGSFTTAIAADNLKRKWICMELNEGFFKDGVERVNENRKNLNSQLFGEYALPLEVDMNQKHSLMFRQELNAKTI